MPAPHHKYSNEGDPAVTTERNIQRKSFAKNKWSKGAAIDYFYCTWRPDLLTTGAKPSKETAAKIETKSKYTNIINKCSSSTVALMRDAIAKDQDIENDCQWLNLPTDFKLHYARELENIVKAQIPLDRCVDSWAALVFLRDTYSNLLKRKPEEEDGDKNVCIELLDIFHVNLIFIQSYIEQQAEKGKGKGEANCRS